MKKNSTPNSSLSSAQKSKVQKKYQTSTAFSSFDWAIGRFQIAAGIFLVLWVALWFRAFYIQLIEGPSLAEKANRQHMYTEIVEAQRGTIYDRRGLVLARSIEARSIYANPRAMTKPLEVAKQLSPLIGISEEKLQEIFLRDKAFIWIARKVDDATALKVQEAKLQGIGISREYERVYPQKYLAGQLLGFVGLDNIGLEGIERSFEKKLAGTDIKRIVHKDGQGKRYYMDGQNPPRGEDIHLTIDGQLQHIAEEVIAKAVDEVEAKWGGALVVEVETSEIVAWAQYPFFNPNAFRQSSPEIYRNRIASDALEPGSTLKPFPIAAALEEKIITPESTFNAENGIWKTEYITIRDDGRAYGDLNVHEIMRYSSNIGVAKIGVALGKTQYYNYLSKLGFGARTNIGIAESKGILRIPEEWSDVDLMSASFGQSVAVTGLQMAQAYLTLANDGVFKQLKLVQEKRNTQTGEQRIFSSQTASEIMEMLEEVVESNGTGRRARIDGIRVAGKTGTAQKASKINESGSGYGEARFASFTGIVPADDPRYVIIIMLDEPQTNQYGGTIAAPVFQEVASRILSYGGYLPNIIFTEEVDDSSTNKKEAPKAQTETQDNKDLFPDLINLSLRQSLELLMPLGITPEIRGSGLSVLYQFPAPQSPLPLIDDKGKTIPCVLWLSEEARYQSEENLALEKVQVQTQK